MTSSEIPVLSDPQFDFEADKYFLKCLQQHPNLYDESDIDFKNHLMQKCSSGLIANTLQYHQVKQKWESLKEQYYEEENLQVARSCCDDDVSTNVVNAVFPHYEVMKKLLSPKKNELTENTTCKKRNPRKTSLVESALTEATTLTKQVKQKLTKQLETRSNDLTSNRNVIAGRIIFKELQRHSPDVADDQRIRSLELLAKLSREKRDARAFSELYTEG